MNDPAANSREMELYLTNINIDLLIRDSIHVMVIKYLPCGRNYSM